MKKTDKLDNVLKKAPKACSFTIGTNDFVFTYVVPKMFSEEQKNNICRRFMMFALDKQETDRDPEYHAKFYWLTPDETDDICVQTMSHFGVAEEDWKEYLICARYFQRWPDNTIRQTKPPKGEN